MEDFMKMSLDGNQDKFISLLHKTISKKKKPYDKYYIAPNQLNPEQMDDI